MAARRLKSDRFFTRDYTAEMYTQPGLDWINDSTMVSVLLRHYPSLAPALPDGANAFTPWTRGLRRTLGQRMDSLAGALHQGLSVTDGDHLGLDLCQALERARYCPR